MENNANTATPVNVLGLGPGLPPLDVNATIVAPLPVPVLVYPLPTYGVKRQAYSEGVLVAQQVISAVPCELDLAFGYNSDPTAGNLLFVQLHNKASALVLGDIPRTIIPVYGGKTPFSVGAPIEWSNGLVIGLSTTELTYTAASAFLSFTSTYRTAT